MKDQAAKLREMVDKQNNTSFEDVNLVSVISGKGGVGKTTLITDLYEQFNNSFIIDCDVNAPFFWVYKDKYNFIEGFDTFNNKKVKKSIEKTVKLNSYNIVLVDAGTGLNDINKYYLNMSKIKIFVTTMEDIAILNTMNIMKHVTGHKILYIPTATDDDILDMQSRINKYSKSHLDNSYIMVCSDINDIVTVLERNR